MLISGDDVVSMMLMKRKVYSIKAIIIERMGNRLQSCCILFSNRRNIEGVTALYRRSAFAWYDDQWKSGVALIVSDSRENFEANDIDVMKISGSQQNREEPEGNDSSANET